MLLSSLPGPGSIACCRFGPGVATLDAGLGLPAGIAVAHEVAAVVAAFLRAPAVQFRIADNSGYSATVSQIGSDQ